MPLEKLFPSWGKCDAMTSYRSRLYLRGAVATKNNQAVISEQVMLEEQKRGFEHPGAYQVRLRCFTDGVVLGGREQVGRVVEDYRRRRVYRRRRHPIVQLGGMLFSLREQRSHAFSQG